MTFIFIFACFIYIGVLSKKIQNMDRKIDLLVDRLIYNQSAKSSDLLKYDNDLPFYDEEIKND